MRLQSGLFTAALVAVSVQTAFARDLTVIDFGGASQKAHIDAYYTPYEKSTGEKVIAGEYNGGVAKLKAMVDAGNVTWDLIELEPPELVRGCEEGFLAPIDWERHGKKADYIDAAVTECGVGAFVWSTVLAYNSAKMTEAPSNWADFWNVEKFPGKRGLRKGAKYTMEFALLADGVAREDVYSVLGTEEGVEQAFAKLDQLKENIQWWEAGAQPPQWLAAGDVVMSSAYNGRISAAKKEGTALELVWDGSVYALDYWAIPRGSENMDQIYDFLAIAADPANQMAYSQNVPYGPTISSAVDKMTPELLAEMPTAAENLAVSMQSDTEFWVENGEDLEEQFNAWASR